MLYRDARLPGVLVCSLLALLLSGCDPAALTSSDTESFEPRSDFASFSARPVSPTVQAGLDAWRKPGALMNGAACVNCHAPDAFDLAYFDFDDATIMRRGLAHLDTPDVDAIIAMVHDLRTTYNITPKDPMEARPLQPGGTVLPGATVAERDLAFGQQLANLGFEPALTPVLTRGDAAQAKRAWLDIDPRTLPVGIAFNRWSEDAFHGSAHSTMADWLPDLPSMPSAALSDQWYALQDAYLANPSDDNLFALLENLDALTEDPYVGDGNELMREKYRSVLVAQHMFRQETLGGAFSDRPTSAFYPARMNNLRKPKGPNPVWEVGTFARDEKHGNFDLPPEVMDRFDGTLKDEMTRMRIPWFWAGWLFDQGLQRTHPSNSVKSAEYLLHHIRTDYGGYRAEGYSIHALFAVTKRIVEQNDNPELGRGAEPPSLKYSNFHGYGRAHKLEPDEPQQQAIYRLLVENSYRMMLFRVQEHILTHGVPDTTQKTYKNTLKDWRSNIQHMRDFFNHAQTEHHAQNLQIMQQTLDMMKGTRPEDLIAAGMAAWRKPGALMGGAACVNCHAPDAFDLAYFDFDDATIVRRGLAHLEQPDVDAIVAMIHTLRQEHGITPKDPMTHRPFQPGGHVLPGATVADRDLAFGEQLASMAFSPATTPILSAADAEAAQHAWLDLDVRTLPIGIAFNRWSEDAFHGSDHSTMADWLPDLPFVPNPDQEAEWYALHDAYLANPSDETLFAIYDGLKTLTAHPYSGAGNDFVQLKYRSVLVAQHLFREETAGAAFSDRPTSAFYPTRMNASKPKRYNPIWDVGDFARSKKHGTFDLPPEVMDRFDGTLKDEMTRMRIPWFWAGWLFDQGLQRTHPSNSTKSGEYITHHLRTDFGNYKATGYAMHNLFMITKKLVEQNDNPVLGRVPEPPNLSYSNFHGYGRAHKLEPTDGRQAQYRLMVENSYRMMLYRVQAYVGDHGVPDASQKKYKNTVKNWLRNMDIMEDFFEHAQTAHYAHNMALLTETRALLSQPST